ncbi:MULTISPECIES: 3-oxoacyl-ACP synthase III family protein [Burkholderia]|uniref:3-oxoacyl-ACP synthase III family protein n=1 Tax=Burkholderia TaxID=32008 RepID=UPI000841E065|nr:MULTISPECIES: 3-oxoacyl-[acyl-carrier-protein] synthase III C-terminal domain-containing protein [unclassified Burkholderia]AOK32279.1 3-oxoacyl-ACP synthase [Burkholderia sp. Bp7605]
MKAVSLIDVSSYLPENRVTLDYFLEHAEHDELAENVMFRAPRFRHHASPDETATDMIERACAGMIERHGRSTIQNVDILITHSQLPDIPFVGCGGEVAHRFGMRPEWVIDLHNGGCASFIYMIKLARQIMQSSGARTALIASAQNCAAQIFTQSEVRKTAQAAIPGDGAGVGLLELSDASPILDIECRTYGKYAGEMKFVTDPPRKYWEAGPGQCRVGFTEESVTKVLLRGSRQVPEIVQVVCERIGVPSKDLGALITNQPNRTFLKNWRTSLNIPPERHPDTFDQCGNLFGAGIPVTFDHAVSSGQLQAGNVVMFAGFAHTGDFAGAAAIQWGGRSS